MKIFINGNIITVDESNPSAEAVVINKGKILFVGTTDNALKMKKWNTKIIDLKGKTINRCT
jgi:predicted amidohydrolase YtcJ